MTARGMSDPMTKSRVLRMDDVGILVGVTPTDLLTYVGITGLFAVVGACPVLPVRATRFDPGAALRQE